MAVRMTERLGALLFRYRSYTPLPFLMAVLFFARPTVPSLIAGFLLVIGGELVRLWAASVAGCETRSTRIPTGKRLVMEGPFAVVRNPMYLANLTIYSGIGIMSLAWFPWLPAIAVAWFAVQYRTIIGFEETFLSARFGTEYEAYRTRVWRFLPRFRGDRPGAMAISVRGLSSGVASERKTFQALAAVMAAMVVIFLAQR